MKTWILILIVQLGYGTASTSTEFNSKESCEVAGKAIEKQVQNAWYSCVEK